MALQDFSQPAAELSSASENPLARFVERQGVLVLDGGLATTLEARGYDLRDDLWSAKILLEAPEAIRQVHLDFLAAGADCLITSTYQASLPGFRKRGLSDREGVELLRLSVRLAVEARDAFWRDADNHSGRLRPIVAASVGPYGAFLSDGSEYTGRYDIDDEALYAFHKERWDILCDSPAELLACETIPCRREAGVLMRLLQETPDRWAWMSFSCRNDVEISDGTKLIEVARDCDTQPRVAAVGINCTPPQYIAALVRTAHAGTQKPIMVYPNAGETYDAERMTWEAAPLSTDWRTLSSQWAKLGAVAIGGCCRVNPQEIAAIRQQTVNPARL
ncbi:MAG: homocysteine S-methyltransferase [Acidobacteria bacterium]|nr:homocysteine S-methyltransferase [Acidobacteriota bacterium]